jgi:hypothetical protein
VGSRPAAGDGDVLAWVDGGCRRDVVTSGRHDPPDGGPVAYGGDGLGRPGTARPGDHEVEVAQAGLPHRPQGGGVVGGGVEDQDRGSDLAGVGPPEVDALGQLDGLAGGLGVGGRHRHGDQSPGHPGHDQRAEDARPPWPRPAPLAGMVMRDGVTGHTGQSDRDKGEGAAGVEVGKREPGGGAGDGRDPPQEQAGREVEEGRDGRADEAGRDAGDEPPDHDWSGGGGREQVGGERGEGDAAEDGDEDRCHADLRGQGDGQRGRQVGAVDQWRPEDGHADAGRDREEEADRAGEERIDEDEHADRERDDPQRCDRAAQGCRHDGDGGHGHRPEDRGLPPGEHAEHAEDRDPGHQPSAQAQAAEQRPGDGEGEGDVLPRDREQVAEAGGPEVVDLGRRLFSVVAEDEAGEERSARAERRCTPHQRAPELVGEPCDRAAGRAKARGRDREAGADVAPGEIGTAAR